MSQSENVKIYSLSIEHCTSFLTEKNEEVAIYWLAELTDYHPLQAHLVSVSHYVPTFKYFHVIIYVYLRYNRNHIYLSGLVTFKCNF